MRNRIRLTERDLTRIVKRVINEQDSTTKNRPERCDARIISNVKLELTNGNGQNPIKVENVKSFNDENIKDTLVITHPTGTCFCRASEFFG